MDNIIFRQSTFQCLNTTKKQNQVIQKDIDHLITFNRNGLWIKRKF